MTFERFRQAILSNLKLSVLHPTEGMQNLAGRVRNEAVIRCKAWTCLLVSASCFLLSPQGLPQSKSGPPQPEIQDTPATEVETSLPEDWAPALLDVILSSPNSEARDALHRAAFAAGPAIVPQLAAALKDDRTAEFAAQSLAFVGGAQALEILSKLVNDPRDLDLRRFYYGALGEFQTPEATRVLLEAINRADAEPDRTVTEAAILALTVRSDRSLVPTLRQVQAKIKDFVLRDDLDNALDVIEARTRYLASAEGKQAVGSVEQAVRTYFIPALEPPLPDPSKTPPAKSFPPRGSPHQTNQAGASSRRAGVQIGPRVASRPRPAETGVKVEIQSLILLPDKTRALARVIFEDPTALANYDIVLQKQYGNWAIASVWLGSEVEKTPPQVQPKPSE